MQPLTQPTFEPYPLPGQLVLGTRDAVQHFDTSMVSVDDYGYPLEELGHDIAACFQLPPASDLHQVHQYLTELTLARVGHRWLAEVQRALLPLAHVILVNLRVLYNSMPEAWSQGQFAYFFGRWHQYDLTLRLVNLKRLY